MHSVCWRPKSDPAVWTHPPYPLHTSGTHICRPHSHTASFRPGGLHLTLWVEKFLPKLHGGALKVIGESVAVSMTHTCHTKGSQGSNGWNHPIEWNRNGSLSGICWYIMVYLKRIRKHTIFLHQRKMTFMEHPSLPAPGGNLYLPEPVAWRYDEDAFFRTQKDMDLDAVEAVEESLLKQFLFPNEASVIETRHTKTQGDKPDGDFFRGSNGITHHGRHNCRSVQLLRGSTNSWIHGQSLISRSQKNRDTNDEPIWESQHKTPLLMFLGYEALPLTQQDLGFGANLSISAFHQFHWNSIHPPFSDTKKLHFSWAKKPWPCLQKGWWILPVNKHMIFPWFNMIFPWFNPCLWICFHGKK